MDGNPTHRHIMHQTWRYMNAAHIFSYSPLEEKLTLPLIDELRLLTVEERNFFFDKRTGRRASARSARWARSPGLKSSCILSCSISNRRQVASGHAHVARRRLCWTTLLCLLCLTTLLFLFLQVGGLGESCDADMLEVVHHGPAVTSGMRVHA